MATLRCSRLYTPLYLFARLTLLPPISSQLHWATLAGCAEACTVLIDAGARLDRKNRLKVTIVDYAVKYEQVKLKVKYESLMEK